MTKVARVCESIVAGIESGSLRDGDRLPETLQSQPGSSFTSTLATRRDTPELRRRISRRTCIRVRILRSSSAV